jgi:hypothetical protein
MPRATRTASFTACHVSTWDDNSVSSCRSYGRAEGAGTSAGVFPVAPPYLEKFPAVRKGCEGVLWDPRTP